MSNNYYEQDISKRAKVIGSSYDNIDVRCSGDACNFDQVKYDSHLNSPGPTRWASYPTLPDKDGKCKDEWLQFDWSDDKGSGYKIDMVSVLYGLYSFEFDGSKVIANTTLPSISVTPPKPANAPAIILSQPSILFVQTSMRNPFRKTLDILSSM
ncbi:hypothetical protein BC829DRAFT_438560 [Chytridium lagenaria]|nr:hypothetical protein BC829DRAFT_438560 [Chytridium lagenaria]